MQPTTTYRSDIAMSRLKRPATPYLYKYGSLAQPERLRSIVLDHRIYFPTADQLNDPTECLPIFADHSLEEMTEYLADHPGATESDLAPIRFNAQRFGIEVLLREMRRTFEQQLDRRYGILSLSKCWDSLPLWAHYADNHRGYCLEFRNALNFASGYEVAYAEKRPLRFSSALEDYQADFLFTKHPSWAYEQEVRILVKPPGLYSLIPELLYSVLLGKDVPPRDEAAVVEWARQRSPRIQVFRLMFEPASQQLQRRPTA
jgi:hypothetical protein